MRATGFHRGSRIRLGRQQRRIRIDQVADPGSGRGGEAVVEQMRGLLPRRNRLPRTAHQHCHQSAAVAVGGTHERLPGVVGVAGLAAERARIVVEQLVVVLQLVARMVAVFTRLGRVPGEVVLLGGDDVRESRVLPGVPVEQADVVGRCAHARSVQAGRRRGPGVLATELAGQPVDLLQRGVPATDLHRQRVRGIVARVHQQAVQQVVDGVLAALVDTDPGAFGVRVVLGALDHFVQRQLVDRLHRDEDLDDARGPMPGMGIARGDDVTGVEVSHHPRLCRDVVGNRGSARRDDHAAAGQRVAAHRLGGHGKGLWRVAGFRHFRGVDGRRRGHPIRAGVGIRVGPCGRRRADDAYRRGYCGSTPREDFRARHRLAE